MHISGISNILKINYFSLCGTLFFILFIFFKTQLLEGVYVSHIILFLIFIYLSIRTLIINEKYFLFYIFIVLLLIMASILPVIGYGAEQRMFREFIKIILIVVIPILIHFSWSSESIWKFLSYLPYVTLLSVMLQILFEPTILGRYTLLPDASANTTGLFLLFNIIVLHFKNTSSFVMSLLKIIMYSVFLLLLILTFSRSNLVAYLIFLLFKGNITNILIISSFIISVLFILPNIEYFSSIIDTIDVFHRYNIIAAITETGGSLRLPLWKILVTKWLDNPFSWLFGFGSGSINLSFSNKIFLSAHSVILSTIYYFGIFGIIGLLMALSKIWQILKKRNKFTHIKESLVIIFLVTGIFDNIILASQITFFVAIFLGFVVSVPKNKRIDNPN